MPEPTPMVAEQFEDAQQQYEAATLGMWIFIATEILFFGGLFLAYLVYRHFYFADFGAASKHTDLFFGTLNSVVLLTSSYTMALAVQFARASQTKLIVRCLMLTLVLGVSFLVVKGFEYHKDFADRLVPGPHFNPSLAPPAQIFFWLYWAMTGLHAIHICVGLGLMIIMILKARSHAFSRQYFTPLELTGLYWHFVDIVWLFLYPLLYLVNRHT